MGDASHTPPGAALLARRAYDAGRYDEALTLAEAGLAAGGEPGPLSRVKALALIRLGRGDEADTIVAEIMTEAPDPEFMSDLAEAMAR